MKTLIINNGHIVDPSQKLDKVGNLLITEGKIAWLRSRGTTPPSSNYNTIDASGLIICPGFKSSEHIGFHHFGSQHDDRDVGELAHASTNLVTVQVWHQDI